MRRSRLAAALALAILGPVLGVTVDATPAAASAAVEVGGTLTADTTWTAAGGPYIASSVVVIPAGVTLTIEPGAVVTSGFDVYDSDRSMFEVAGRLNAVGTPEQLITLANPSYSLFGGPPTTTTSTATGVVDVEDATLTFDKLLHASGTDRMSSPALAALDVSDSTLRGRNADLTQVGTVSLVRDGISLGVNDTNALSINPANGPVTLHQDLLRATMLTCQGAGTLTVRNTTFEHMAPPAWADGSGVRTSTGCGVDARDNYWETGGSLESRIIDGVDTEGLPIADVSTRLAAPADGTATLSPGWFSTYLQIRAYSTGLTSWWDAAPSGGLPVSYTVEALPEGVWTPEQTIETTATNVAFQHLDTTQRYRIRVTPHNADGTGPSITSDLLAPIDVHTAPAAPSLTVTRTPLGASATWVSQGDGGDPIEHWDWTLTSDTEPPRTGTTTATSVTLDDLSAGSTYRFQVNGVNYTGAGAPATATFAAADLPGAPTGVTATAGPGSATVTWTPPPVAPGAAVTGYRVVDGARGTVVTVSGDKSSVRIGSLRNGASYAFAVTALDAIGQGPASVASNVVVPADRPGVPGRVRAAARNNAAVVRWRRAAAHGAPVRAYRVTVYPGRRTLTVAGSARSALVKRLRPRTRYRFVVRAVNRVGAGPNSALCNRVRPY